MNTKNFNTIVQPYAEALIEIAQSSQSLDKVNADMAFVETALANSIELRSYLWNPLVSKEEKLTIVNKVFSDHISRISLHFLKLLIDRKRINFVNYIISKYLELGLEIASVTLVKITSAVTLSDEQLNLLTDKIKLMYNSRQIQLDLKIDPTLIAGFTVQIGSKTIDTSIKGQLEKLYDFMEIGIK
uniref:ATP synthase CF1 delta subunit n=1 Tax=Dixoniella grisea TaxID=35153 RepID=UPI001FCE2BD5|nr:ATP synthase CF1 delta subunit [Dixoniella grisea]UNJ17099.1 ATP synthase CF1 delta subunit [Dixoniella grisea]